MKLLYLLTGVLFGGVLGCHANDGTGPTTNQRLIAASETWVAIEPIQCLGNPWERDWLEKNGGDYSRYPKNRTTSGLAPAELEIIQEYYAGHGVVVLAVKTVPKYEAVCRACHCPEGHTMYLLVRGEDVEIMRGYGYRVDAPPDI